MNKERELLKECRLILDTPFNGSTGINLRNRIAELLAQPEQEPVYWENEKKALLNEIDHLTNRLAQPELSTDSLQLDEQDLREDLREGLRDHFAGLAMQGLLASDGCGIDSVSKFAYKCADAMIKTREVWNE